MPLAATKVLHKTILIRKRSGMQIERVDQGGVSEMG